MWESPNIIIDIKSVSFHFIQMTEVLIDNLIKTIGDPDLEIPRFLIYKGPMEQWKYLIISLFYNWKYSHSNKTYTYLQTLIFEVE